MEWRCFFEGMVTAALVIWMMRLAVAGMRKKRQNV